MPGAIRMRPASACAAGNAAGRSARGRERRQRRPARGSPWRRVPRARMLRTRSRNPGSSHDGIHEPEQRALRVRVRDDDVAGICSPLASTTRRARPRRPPRCRATSAPVRISAPASRRGRGHRLGEPADAAAHEARCARRLPGCAAPSSSSVADRAGRSRPEVGAEHAARGDGRAEDVRLEPVLREVGHRHRRHAQQAVRVRAPEPAEAAARLEQVPQLRGARAIDRRRHLPREVGQQRRALA